MKPPSARSGRNSGGICRTLIGVTFGGRRNERYVVTRVGCCCGRERGLDRQFGGGAKNRREPCADLSDLLNDYHGRVLILLLGRDGCPGTAKATAALNQYVSSKPERVSVVRLNVPLPKETLKPTSDPKRPFPYFVDTGRKIAGKLEFFYYPTLYVFDGQGKQRYVGGCDKDKIATMVREILAEKPGAKKKRSIRFQCRPSANRAAFSGNTLTGKAVTRASLTKKRGLLMLFARTSCPFSAADIPQFKDIAGRLGDKGVGVVVVNQQEELGTIKPVYEEKCAGVPVIWDRGGKICKSFGVDAVPFFSCSTRTARSSTGGRSLTWRQSTPSI